MAAEPVAAAGVADLAPRGGRSRIISLHRIVRQRSLLVGAALLLAVVAIAVRPSLFEPHDPVLGRLLNANAAPGGSYWLGADAQGRDVFSRIIAGTRSSLVMGLIPVAIGLSVGGLLGLLAGYYQRLGDIIIMRFIDMMMAFPGIILALTIVAALGTRHGSNIAKAMVAIGIALIPTFARVTRGSVLSAKEYLYIDAARSIGCGDRRIMFVHLLPNVVAPLIVLGTLSIAGAVLVGASLSFLGLGAQPPSIDWGSMVNDGREKLATAWWISTFPGVALMITIISINLVGDGVRDLLDPRLRM
jgi:peptide/nickel transport system permease protein